MTIRVTQIRLFVLLKSNPDTVVVATTISSTVSGNVRNETSHTMFGNLHYEVYVCA